MTQKKIHEKYMKNVEPVFPVTTMICICHCKFIVIIIPKQNTLRDTPVSQIFKAFTYKCIVYWLRIVIVHKDR